ncbi:MAG: Rrf2 family transcriptional regulator [Planctomycetes bacterium]|nr:Rrf2 family transcriptional regulator [Planctomycetota bacterium]
MSFSLTRKTDYALVALSALAQQEGGHDNPLSAREIAERHQLPAALLMNVLKDLHRGGVLCSRRGAGGGYILCHDPSKISLLQIIEATEGQIKVAACCDENEENACAACAVMPGCPVTTPMQRFNDLTRGFLASVKLSDLIESPASVSLTRTGVRA